MALTITFKRKFYASETAMENAGETVGGQTGSVVGAGTGAVVGLGAGLTVGGIAGGAKGWNQATKNNNLIKAADDAKVAVQNAKSNIGHAMQGTSKTAPQNLWDAYDSAKKASTAADDAAKGLTKMNRWKTAGKKAGKWGLIAGLGTAVAGGVLGSQAGKSTGQSVGAAAGNVVGGTVDSINNRIAGNNQQRQYAVSQASKNIWGAVKGFIPKSKRMKAARGVVKADQAVQKTAFEAATNPGSLAKKAVETVGKNPLSVAPGYTASTGVLTAAKKGRLTTPDMVLKNTMIGKPVYAATEYTGRKLGRLAEPIVNSAYQMARVM